MRSFPPIRDDYRGFDVWVRQFENRNQAERYIRDRNTGNRAGRVDDTQRKLLDYNFGDRRYVDSRHVSPRGKEYRQLHVQTTHEVTIKGKVYRAGSFVPFQKDEKEPEFKRMTLEMLEADRKKGRRNA
jgi:hypothetical protein